MSRDDLRGVIQTDSGIQACLTRRFGKNPYGEPRYRFIWSQARIEQSGGTWVDWRSETKMNEKTVLAGNKPWRTIGEMRTVRKYPNLRCWMVEKWVPASAFGLPEQWYLPEYMGGTLVETPHGWVAGLGEYPFRGDYMETAIKFERKPPVSVIESMIAYAEWKQSQAPGNVDSRIRQRVRDAYAAEEKRLADYDAFASDVIRDADTAFGNNPYIGYYGTHRPAIADMAEKIGIKSHVY